MKKFNSHFLFAGALLLFSLFFLNGILHRDKILNNMHYVNDLTFLSYNAKEAVENNEFPFWLVASERFAFFPGWDTSINGNNIQIFKVDNAITASYLDGNKGKLVFEYKPSSYRIGKIISFAAIILIVIYFGYFIHIKKFKSGGSN